MRAPNRGLKKHLFLGKEERTMRPIKIIVEKHPDGYVAYPLGLKGIIVG
jgi:hypothetical protein